MAWVYLDGSVRTFLHLTTNQPVAVYYLAAESILLVIFNLLIVCVLFSIHVLLVIFFLSLYILRFHSFPSLT
jgi:hypothetical protein